MNTHVSVNTCQPSRDCRTGWRSILLVPAVSASTGIAARLQRVHDCSYSVDVHAPQGQSGRFFALAQVPLFLPKLAAGAVSGASLRVYIPNPRTPR